MTNFSKKQKTFIVGISSFIVLFVIFIGFSYFFATSNSNFNKKSNDYKIAESTTSAIENSKKDDNDDSKRLETATNSNIQNNDQTNSNLNENGTPNTNANAENKDKNTIESNASNNIVQNTPNENYQTQTNNNTLVQTPNVNKSNENSTIKEPPKEDYNFIVNIQIGDVDNILWSGTVKTNNTLTAYKALELFANESSIEVKKSGSGSLIYVTSIGGLKEKDKGPSSGWMYKVNGNFPSVAAGNYTLNSGDTIEWVYTHDGGKDVGSR